MGKQKKGFVAMRPVNSTMIKSLSYHKDDRVLLVRFHSGVDYYYDNVPHYVYKELLAANKRKGASVGKLFISMVRSEPSRTGRKVNA